MKSLSEMIRERVQLVLTFLTFLQLLRASALTIDNQLVITANDCYARISIGSGLLDKDVSSRIEVNTVSDCEDECSKRRRSCKAFSFGISTKGNGTCAIGPEVPKDLQVNPDYDVYVRHQNLLGCEPDQFHKISNGSEYSYNNGGYINNNNRKPAVGFGNGPLPPKSSTFHSSKTDQAKDRPTFYGNGRPWDHQGWFSLRDNEQKFANVVTYNDDRQSDVKSSFDGSRPHYYGNNVNGIGRPINKGPFYNRFPTINDGTQFHVDSSYREAFGTAFAEEPPENSEYLAKPKINYYGEQSIFQRPLHFSWNSLRTDKDKTFNGTNLQAEYNGKKNSYFSRPYEFSNYESSTANYGFRINHNLGNSQFMGPGYNRYYDDDRRFDFKNLYGQRPDGQSTRYDKIRGLNRLRPLGSDLINYDHNDTPSNIAAESPYNFYGYAPSPRKRPQDDRFQSTYFKSFNFGNLLKSRYKRIVNVKSGNEKTQCK